MFIQSVVAWALAAAASLGIRDGNIKPDIDHPASTSVVALIMDEKVHCSGVLIAEDVVVTAGHCIPTMSPSEGSPLKVYFGSEVEERSWDQTQIRPAIAWAGYHHPEFEDLPELLMLKDLGWVKFSGGIPEPAEGQVKLRPIDIAGQDVLVSGEIYQIGGYGIDTSGISARRSGQVRFSHIPKFRTIGEVAMVDSAPSLPCPADSGSGLFAKVPDQKGGQKWAVIGIASEIHYNSEGPPEVAYAEWSPVSQCASAERATYVLIGADDEWLFKDSKNYPVRIIPNEIRTFEQVPAPTTLRELCEYPNALTSTWLTATALIHAVRDQYKPMEPRTEGFCRRFETYVREQVAASAGELTLNLLSDFITQSADNSRGQRQLRLDFNALNLVPGLKRLIVEPVAEVRGVDTVSALSSLEDLVFKSPVLGAESLASLNLRLLDLAISSALGSRDIDFSVLRSMGTLNLTLENFTEIPEGLAELTNIHHITLRYTDEIMGPLNLQLDKIRGLKSLSLINYPGAEWGLGVLPSLEHLFVYGGSLTEINLDSVPKLLTLVTEGAPIAGFSGRFANSEIRWISSRFSNLTELPAEFGDLAQLSYLDLKGNNLSSLPASFAGLENLEFLNLSINLFEEFPQVLLGLSSLQFLDISRNTLVVPLTEDQAVWIRGLTDYVPHDSFQIRYANFFKGNLSQRLSELRSELGGFAQYSQRATY